MAGRAATAVRRRRFALFSLALLLSLVCLPAQAETYEPPCGEIVEGGGAGVTAFLQKIEFTNPILRYSFGIPELGADEASAARLAACLRRLEAALRDYFQPQPEPFASQSWRRYRAILWLLGYYNFARYRDLEAFREVREAAAAALGYMTAPDGACDVTLVLYLRYAAEVTWKNRIGERLRQDLLGSASPRRLYVAFLDKAGCGDPWLARYAGQLLLTAR